MGPISPIASQRAAAAFYVLLLGTTWACGLVPDVNIPPQVSIKPIGKPMAGQPIPSMLDASGLIVTFRADATDPDSGKVVSYQWDFGDSTTSQEGPTVIHKYAVKGIYFVGLTVTDDDGGISKAPTLRAVIPGTTQGPRAQIIASRTDGPAPLDVDFDGSVSVVSDPDDKIVQYAWVFGDDGSTKSGPTAHHRFERPGRFDVTLTVTDSLELQDSRPIGINVGASQ